MPRPLDEQVIVLTGASSGIGRSTARRLAARGARLVLTARRSDVLAQLAAEIERDGGTAIAVPGDVTREEDLRGVARAAVERFGRIDTWINGASVFVQGRVEDIGLDEYRRVLDVNLVGLVNGTRCALEAMRKQDSGTIVQISSVMGKHGTPLFSPYAAAKAGIDGFCDALRAELWGTGIRVATVYPPNVDTPIYRHARSKFGTVPRPELPVVGPDLAARIIAELAVRSRPERTFGAFGHLYVAMTKLLPTRLVDALLHGTQGLGRSDLPAGEDNLDRPLDELPRERGGWAELGWRGITARQLARGLPWPSMTSFAGRAALAVALAGSASRIRRRGPISSPFVSNSRRGGPMRSMNAFDWTKLTRGRRTKGLGLAGALIKGAIAGAAGVWAMDRVGWFLWNRQDPRTLEQEREVRVRGMDPAHNVANAVANAVGTELVPAQPHSAGVAVHYAIGIVPAMLYSVYRGRVKGLAAGRGLLYGLGLFVAVDVGMTRLLGIAASPRAYPWQAHARGVATHLVLGAVTDRALGVLDRAA